MGREDDILAEIKKMPGESFETFAVELIMQELYPGLNPTSLSHDGGEDAITYGSVTFLHNGKYISVAASKTNTFAKIRRDCLKCKNNKRDRDVPVFVTVENVQTDTIEKWKTKIQAEFGWDLEVYTARWILPVVCRAHNENLVDRKLGVPPPDGDYTSTIKSEFAKTTSLDLRSVRRKIPGLEASIYRTELAVIEDQLALGKSVILTGDPGTGKSGLGAMLADNGAEQDKMVLFVDARRFATFRSESDISNHFHLRGSFTNAVARAGNHGGCRIILDQFDSVIGLEISEVLAELARHIASFDGVQVIIITRKKEGHEKISLRYLNDNGFVEIESYPLSADRVMEILGVLGISGTDELIKMSSNLLNLELIGEIKQNNPTFDFQNLLNEVDLWEKFIDSVKARETRVINTDTGDFMIIEATRLARIGLITPDREFILEFPSKEQKRLISWEIIFNVEGYRYRFRHEKLQDFLYAKHAVSHGWLKDNVLAEISKHRTINIFRWMQSLYDKNKSPKRIELMKEMLNVS